MFQNCDFFKINYFSTIFAWCSTKIENIWWVNLKLNSSGNLGISFPFYYYCDHRFLQLWLIKQWKEKKFISLKVFEMKLWDSETYLPPSATPLSFANLSPHNLRTPLSLKQGWRREVNKVEKVPSLGRALTLPNHSERGSHFPRFWAD